MGDKIMVLPEYMKALDRNIFRQEFIRAMFDEENNGTVEVYISEKDHENLVEKVRTCNRPVASPRRAARRKHSAKVKGR